MSNIAKRQDELPGIPEPANMLAMVMRAASDPDVDAGKMEKLLDMALRLEERQAKAAYTKAMAEMKPELPVIDKRGKIIITDKNDKTKVIQSTAYGLWEDIDAAITPILMKFGFVLTFRTGNLPDGRVTVTGVLSHVGGHSEESEMALPLDTSGSKNNVQAAGSSTSYGKRYTAGALLNLRFKGEDDNGKAGGDPGPISEEQAERLMELLEADKADVAQFCSYLGKKLKMEIKSILEIPAAQYNFAVEIINTRSQKVKAKAEAGNAGH